MRKKRVYVQEVVTRDGFQIDPTFVSTEEKVRLIDELSQTGLAKIEVTSFVSPKAVPNLRDAEEVMQNIQRAPGVIYAVLVPNLKGAERAVASRADEINLVMSVSETHNRANVRRTNEESMVGFREIMQTVSPTGIKVNGTLATSFGCPFEGDVSLERVMGYAERYLEMGMTGLTFADTTGMAHPAQVEQLAREAKRRWPAVPITLHFHNTRGMGLANILAGLQAGIERFDGALGGLGGCPFAPGATGNVCTEDFAHMLHFMGFDTGVDLDKLLAAARRLPQIVGHDVPGQVSKSGMITDLHPVPAGI